ncbi:hypothetical protein OO96_20465 [Escherichia coli]|nr:hypothetical protein OO96_20465 [Escherichia coli]
MVDKVRFVHAGCGVNALSGLQNHANSIYCTNHVGLIRRSASGSFFVCHQSLFYAKTRSRICQ